MRFASREWVKAVVDALNGHPDLSRALAGLGKDGAFVVLADKPAWPRSVAAYARQENGRIASWRMLDDEDEVLEIEPAYVFRAPYRVWRALFQGDDPVKAALSGRVQVQGDLEALVRRTGYRYIVDAALGAVTTEFP